MNNKELTLSDLLTNQELNQEHIDKIFMNMIHNIIEDLRKDTGLNLTIFHKNGIMVLNNWNIVKGKTPKEFFHALKDLQFILNNIKRGF